METILQPREAERSRRVVQEALFLQGHHALQVPYSGATLTAMEIYSPDGSSGSVAVTLGDQELYRIDIDGQNVTVLTDGFGNSSSPCWSNWLQ